MAKSSADAGALIRLRHPDARSCSFAGRAYAADRDGVVAVPPEAAAALAAHGFVPAPSEPRKAGE